MGSVSWNSSRSSRWYLPCRAARTSALSRNRFRARTSRSWNSSRPSPRRVSADCRTRKPHQWTIDRSVDSTTWETSRPASCCHCLHSSLSSASSPPQLCAFPQVHWRSAAPRRTAIWAMSSPSTDSRSSAHPDSCDSLSTNKSPDPVQWTAMAVHCTGSGDLFVDKLSQLSGWADDLESVEGDDIAQMAVLRGAADLQWTWGKAHSWGGLLAELKDECRQWQQEAGRLVSQVVESTLRSIVHWCGLRVLQSAETRRCEGRLEFHDLLVLARNLLRDNAEVRAALQGRYQRLLLDEFQDTDPIQIEIAVRIAGGRGATQIHWEDVAVPHGSLFVVG